MPTPYQADSLKGGKAQQHFERKQRIALARMAQACLIDPKRFATEARIDPSKIDRENASAWTHMWSQITLRLSNESLLRLWTEISEVISGGVPSTETHIPNDPYAVFVTGICKDLHNGQGWHKQIAVVKTGHRVDQAEGEKIVLHLKAQANVHTCEICGRRISTWQVDNTRVSTFAASERQGTAMAQPIIRGSDI